MQDTSLEDIRPFLLNYRLERLCEIFVPFASERNRKLPSRRLSDPGFDLLKIPDLQSRVEDSRREGAFGHLCVGKGAKKLSHSFKKVI